MKHMLFNIYSLISFNQKIADHAFRTAGYFSLFTFHYSLFPSIPPLGPKEV